MTKIVWLIGVGVVVTLVWPVALNAQYPSDLVGFNDEPLDDEENGKEMFWEPEFSGTTVAYIVANVPADPYGNNAAFRGGALMSEGAGCLYVFFWWADLEADDPDAWVRLTSFNAPERPNPALDTRGKVRFKITNQSEIWNGEIGLCIGIRETGVDVAQLENGGTTGTIEWVGVSTDDSVIDAGTNGTIESTVLGDDVFVDSNGIQAITWGPNRNLDSTAIGDDVAYFGYVRASDGERVPIPAISIPTSSVPVLVEWDLSAGTVSIDGTPYACGIAGYTGNGVLDAANDRGTLEQIAITNVTSDIAREIIFGIDELQFEATEPDPTPPPVIRAPVYEIDTQVLVDCCYNADTATLMIDGNTNGAHRDVDCTGDPKVATFDVTAMLDVGDVLTATQKRYGLKSPHSLPVMVYAEDTVLAEDFEGYDTQEDLNQYWFDSISYPSPPDAKLRLTSGSAASCDNLLVEDNPSGADAARLYRDFGNVNGSDLKPLWVTWNFRHHINHSNARTKFELARFAGNGGWKVGARAPGTTGFVLNNGPASVPDEFLEQYAIALISDDPRTAGSNGFFDNTVQGNAALTPVQREPVWHKMQIEVRSEVINYYIDGTLANPVNSNGDPKWPDGVPRPNTEPYRFIIIGQGYSNNGPTMMFDNISVTFGDGTLHPFGPANLTESPTVLAPLFPDDTQVTVEDVNSNAERVDVYVDGLWVVGDSAGYYPDNSVTLGVPSLVNDEVVGATQTLSGEESCSSAKVTVGIPAPTVEPVLVPGQTTVEVSNVEENRATVVTVYAIDNEQLKTQIGTTPNPIDDPVDVDVSALNDGDTIVATQTVGGFESPDSAGVVVAVPAPTLLANLAVGDAVVTVQDVHPSADTVTVYVNDVEVGSTNGLSPMTDVLIDPALADADEVVATQTIDGIESPDSNAVLVSAGLCKIIYHPDLSDPTGWTINIATNGSSLENHVVTFGYDYGLMGIPPAPGSSDTNGLKIEANVVDGYPGGVTMSQLGHPFSGHYVFSFDFWHNYVGPAPAGGYGATEMTGGGVGYDGETVNTAMHYPPPALVSGGTSLFVNGDCYSDRVWRMYKDSTETSSGEQFIGSGQYAVESNSHASPEFAAIAPAVDISQFNQGGSQTGVTQEGGPAFAWHHVMITVNETAGTARIVIDGLHLGTLDANIGNPTTLTGPVQLSHYDPYSSLSGEFNFAVFDNVVVAVEQIQGNTPGDWDDDGDIDLDDYERFEDCFSGPDTVPMPITGPGCRTFCLNTFDFNTNGAVDLFDFAEFAVEFTGP